MTDLPPAGGPPVHRRETPAAAALARLGVAVALAVTVVVLLHALNVLVVILAIVAMVMLHELGHFLTAKASGMKVTEYFFGFGPRLWSVRRGETEYGIKAIPAGGYVRITGMTMLEEVSPEDEARSYRQATFPRRILVAVAGSAMHMVIALVLIWAYLVFVGAPRATAPYVVGLLHFAHSKTPAQLAGIRKGDRFVSIDGHPVKSFSTLEKYVGHGVGEPLDVVVERDGHRLHLVITPVDARHVTEYVGGRAVQASGRQPKGIIGVELSSSTSRPVGAATAVPRTFGQFGSLVAANSRGIAEVFSFHGLGQFAHSVVTAGNHQHQAPAGQGTSTSQSSSSGQGTQLMSILGVIEAGSQAASTNPGWLLLLLADINLFVGLVNLFPMLPLDGGHVVIALYERLRSHRGRVYHADVVKLMPVAYVFLAFIVVIGLGALYANIVQPVHLPGG